MGTRLYRSIRYSLVISDQKWKFNNLTISGGYIYCAFNIHVYTYTSENYIQQC